MVGQSNTEATAGQADNVGQAGADAGAEIEAEMAAATLFETPQKLAATTEQGDNKGDRVPLGKAGTFKSLSCWMKPRPAEEAKQAKKEQKPEQSPAGKGNAKKDQNQSQGDEATPPPKKKQKRQKEDKDEKNGQHEKEALAAKKRQKK